MESDCQGCPSGSFCNDTGLSTPSGDCYAGYHCVSNASHPAPSDGTNGPCPAGHYCPQGN